MLNAFIRHRTIVLATLLYVLSMPLTAQEQSSATDALDVPKTQVSAIQSTPSLTFDAPVTPKSELRIEDKTRFIERNENSTPLSEQVEDLKKAALELNRDLLLLEEDLLFPANTQIAVYVSLDVGDYFAMDAVKLTIDGELVASHLYTQKQNSALVRGGIQRLYLGNLKTGKHQITAFFHGIGPQNREYKRGASYTLTKDQKPTMLEIKVRDSSLNMQPTFEFKEWHL